MKLKNIDNVNKFLTIVDTCEGDVYLASQYGDRYALKSKLTQYIAIAALLNKDGDALELWASNKDDEAKLLSFFKEHPEVV